MADDIKTESMVTISGAEYVRLMAENAKLRAALEVFACDCAVHERCAVPDNCRNFQARRALGGDT